MNRQLDVLLVHPGAADVIYQSLSGKFSAIETPTWSLLLAQSCRSKGFGVAILDCDAERLTNTEALKRIKELNPRLVCFTVYGQNPNAGTTKMSGAVELASQLKGFYPEYPICFVGSHTSALPRDVLNYPCVDFVLLNEGVYALRNLLNTDLKTDLQNIKGIGWKDNLSQTLNPPERVVPTELMDVDLPGSAWDLLPYKDKPFDLYRSCNWHANFHEELRTPYASIYSSLGCQYKCFPKGTKIIVSDGPNRAIQKIKIGDKLIGYDEKTGKLAETKVVKLMTNKEASHLLVIKFKNGKTLRCTEEHPFYVHGQWLKAKNLRVGDEIHSIHFKDKISFNKQLYNPSFTSEAKVRLSQHDLKDKEKLLKTIGDFVYNGLEIVEIKKYNLRKPVDVYNFECQPHNNYFVGLSNKSQEYVLSHNCNFCMINILNRVNNEDGINAADSANMRFWSPQFMLKEFDKLASYGVKTIRIADEMFFLRQKYFEPLLNGLIERGYGKDLLMWAYARVDTVRAKYLDLFNDAGIKWLALGIEGADQKIRKEISKGHYEEVDIREIVKQISESGISTIANYIFGLPDDNYDSMNATLDLALELNTEMANFYAAFALPGSPLFYEARNKGWALPQSFEAWSFHSYDCLPLPTKYLSAAEVLRFRDRAWNVYFNRPDYLKLVENKFGLTAAANIKEMASIKLRRKLLGD